MRYAYSRNSFLHFYPGSGTTLLLEEENLASLWNLNGLESPEEALYKYFELFNRADKEAINKASDSPFVFLIGNNKTVSEYYGDSVDFEGLRKQGWAYSKINESKLIYPWWLMNYLRW